MVLNSEVYDCVFPFLPFGVPFEVFHARSVCSTDTNVQKKVLFESGLSIQEILFWSTSCQNGVSNERQEGQRKG